MKYIIEKGHHKTSMYLFIGTGLFLIGLFSYQLFDVTQHHPFVYDFPGDWDKVIGIALGIFLIFRSSVFKVRSRDLFIEISDNTIKYRMERANPINKLNRIDIARIDIKKGKVFLTTKESKRITIVDLNEVRLRDEQKESIINNIKKELNV